MSLKKSSLWISALLVIGGCDEPEPNKPKLGEVTVTCDRTSISATRPVQCAASAKDENGQSLDISDYTWKSNNESVARVSAAGKVTTLIEGAVTLSASATQDGVTKQGETTLTITQAQPTEHSVPVTTNEIWRETENPHVVNADLMVGGANTPSLTLESGTVVRFKFNTGLYVGANSKPGELIVNGTKDSPVLLTANFSAPYAGYWKGVHLKDLTSSATRLSHATIEYAGAPINSAPTANLTVYGDNSSGGARPVINTVIVQKSSGPGVALVDSGAFGPGSTVLTSRDNGGYAISVAANDVGTIPAGGTFSGNVHSSVEIYGGGVGTTQTWPNLGIPYVVRNKLDVVGFSEKVTLTLRAGTQVLFDKNAGLSVGADNMSAALVAVGTAAEPIRFDLNGTNPTPGAWYGLSFWDAPGSKLDHVSISNAGATGDLPGNGNLNVYREIGEFVTNSTFAKSSGCGITVSDGRQPNSTPVTTNFTLAKYNNTFVENTGGAQCTN